MLQWIPISHGPPPADLAPVPIWATTSTGVVIPGYYAFWLSVDDPCYEGNWYDLELRPVEDVEYWAQRNTDSMELSSFFAERLPSPYAGDLPLRPRIGISHRFPPASGRAVLTP